MKKLLLILIAIVFVFLSLPISGFTADVLMNWDSVPGATGYKIQMSTDLGATWSAGVDVGNVTNYTFLGVPDTGLILFRLVAYNAYDETVTTWSGPWFNKEWQAPHQTMGANINGAQ